MKRLILRNLFVSLVFQVLCFASMVIAGDNFTIPYKEIVIDNDFSDWNNVPEFADDPIGDIYESGYFDIDHSYIATDGEYLYLKLQMASDITSANFPCGKTWGEIGIRFFEKNSPVAILSITANFTGSSPPKPSIKIQQWSASGPGTTVMTYPYTSGFVAFNGKNIEFKAHIDKLPFNMTGKDIRGYTHDHCQGIGDETVAKYIVGIEAKAATKGDLNGDGKVNLSDVIVGLKVMTSITTTVTLNGDVDNDHKITMSDILWILRTVAQISPCSVEICNDNIDNDCDGKVDCNDSDCAGSANCSKITCCKCVCSYCGSTVTGSDLGTSCADECQSSCNNNPYCGSYVSSSPCP